MSFDRLRFHKDEDDPQSQKQTPSVSKLKAHHGQSMRSKKKSIIIQLIYLNSGKLLNIVLFLNLNM